MTRRQLWGREFAVPLNTLQDELQRLYDHYRNGGATPTEASSAAGAGAEVTPEWTPPVDLYETPREVGLLADLPGVDPATIELTVTGRVLTIRGEKPRDAGDPSQGRTLERPSGPFLRQVELPVDVDVDAIQAESRNGVLTIRLPKIEATRPQTIPIRVQPS